MRQPTFREALRFWIKLGFVSFGGPAGQIAIMHRELVDRKNWINESRFLHALNFCMLLPGPEATQLATYCGWMLHGLRGALAAGVCFILPAIGMLWGLSWVYMEFGAIPAVAAVFHGLKAAVLAIVVSALLRVARRALKTPLAWGLAALSFVALFGLGVPYPWIVCGALLIGLIGGRLAPQQFNVGGDAAKMESETATRVGLGGTIRLILIVLVLWFLPVVLAGWLGGWQHMLTQMGWFFSKVAVVTFGGAYAVLPYVAQQAVEHHQWLTAAQMLDGLGLAETTPGPLIMVLQFVGFAGGWHHPGELAPLLAATLGALMTVWVTFVPTYGFILVGAPFVERLRGNVHLSAALAAVTAAVVGVMLNLAVWFGLHVWFAAGGVDWFAIGLSVAVFALLQWAKWEIVPVVLTAGLAGFAWSFV